MTECWTEGDLRAYLDRELPQEELDRIAAHVAGCPECARITEELQGRAIWVGEMMGALTVTEIAPRRKVQWRWVAAAAALAAGVAIGIVMRPGTRQEPVAVVPQTVTAAPGEAGLRPVDRMKSGPQAESLPHKENLAHTAGPAHKQSRRAAAPRNEFVALDDEPFDTGVVVRMALGPAEVPADVLFGSDGRAHAIRLVNYK